MDLKGCSEVFEICVPASTSNLGAGFDALSLALKLHLRLRVQEDASGQQFRSDYPEFAFASGQNYIARAASRTAERYGKVLPSFRVRLLEGIPVGKGLGSSAAALVAGILLADRLCVLKLTTDQIVELGTEMEGHPDNVTGALLGGLVLSVQAGKRVLYRRFAMSARLFVLVIPKFELPTEKARAVLPASYSRSDVVYNVQRSSLLAALLAAGDFPDDRELLGDRLHQPYRADLIPGFDEITALRLEGLVGATLSGAGPTVLLWCRGGHEAAGRAAVEIFEKHGVKSHCLLLGADNDGARITRAD